MGGRGATSSSTGGKYVRFGEIPTGGSINYTKLTGDQREDIRDLINGGLTPEDAIKTAKSLFNSWKNVDVDDVLEKGVSVFKADKNGMPVIENMEQAKSLATRLDGRSMFSMSGTVSGTGQDGEPVLSDAKGKKVNYNVTKMENHLIDTLKKNFSEVKGKKDNNGGRDIQKFYDNNTGQTYYVYKGYEFRKPKKGFE